MKKIFLIIIFISGILGLWAFLDHIINFSSQDWFFQAYPNTVKYVGTNIVSPFADLSYFTYHTCLFYCLWAIGYTLSCFFKWKKIKLFLSSNSLIAFIYTNYVITMVFYTIFELMTTRNFGLYALTNSAIHNFGTNIFIHYILFAIATIAFFKVEGKKSSKSRSYILISVYLLLYFVIVKITGLYCYKIEWYPYFIFDGETFCNLLKIQNQQIGLVILIVVDIIIYFLYILLYTGMKKIKEKMEGKLNVAN